METNFVTSCEIQLLRKHGRHPRCQIHLYPHFRRRSGQDCAYSKLSHRIRRRTVGFDPSFVEKTCQRARLSSKNCSISLPMSEEYVWTTSSKRSWRVALLPSYGNAENHWKRTHPKLRNGQLPRCYINKFFSSQRRSDTLSDRRSTSVFIRAQRKLVWDQWSHASPECNSTSSGRGTTSISMT